MARIHGNGKRIIVSSVVILVAIVAVTVWLISRNGESAPPVDPADIIDNIPDAEVIGWITLNAAKAMGIDEMTGSLEPGKMADVVLWNDDPLSVYARPEKVWIDGALMYDAMDRKRRPVSDFELGQPGEGDVK